MATNSSTLTSTVPEPVKKVVQRAYDGFVRDHLPRTWCVYGDIPARDNRLLDTTDYKPHYKEGLVSAIREGVHDGDNVVLVGGGRGISSVHCARQGATVTAYEASAEMCDIARETVARQGWSQAVDVRHAIVGEALDVFGELGKPDAISPDALETGDVLIMDCEGAEMGILRRLEDWPATVIVETHPGMGATTGAVRTRLEHRGYDVTDRAYEPGHGASKRVVVGATDD